MNGNVEEKTSKLSFQFFIYIAYQTKTSLVESDKGINIYKLSSAKQPAYVLETITMVASSPSDRDILTTARRSLYN